MPRYRNPFRRPQRNPHLAPPPVVVKEPTVDLPRLQLAYDWMTLDKMLGFKLVLEWYAANQVALLWKDALDQNRQRRFDLAMKSQRQGDGTPYEGEKIAAYTMAIHLFEKIWAHKLPNFPLLDTAVHASRVSPYISNVQTVLNNLNGAFGGAGCKFRITFNADREFLHGEILLPQAQIDAMIPLAPLTVVLTEAPTVAKVLSIVTDDAGQQKLDGGRFMQKLPEVLAQVSNWAAGHGAVNKPVGKAVRQGKPAKAGGPRAARQANPANFKVRDTDVIHFTGAVNKAFKGGKRGAVWQMLFDGMTVTQLRQAATQIGPGYAVQVLKVMITAGLVRLN